MKIDEDSTLVLSSSGLINGKPAKSLKALKKKCEGPGYECALPGRLYANFVFSLSVYSVTIYS